MATETQPKTPGKLQALLDMAHAAQKTRKDAPLMGVTGGLRIPQKDIIARFTVDQGGKNDVDGGYHYLFDDQNTGASRASDGYELVIENGDVVRYQTDVLYRIPTEFFKASLMADKERSDIMMRTEMTRAAQEAKAAGGSANVRVVQTGPDADKAAKTG